MPITRRRALAAMAAAPFASAILRAAEPDLSALRDLTTGIKPIDATELVSTIERLAQTRDGTAIAMR